MNRGEAWILALSGIAFAAGGAVGLLVGQRSDPPSPLAPAFADYEKRFHDAIGLSPEERGILREILLGYQEDVAKVKNRFALLPEPQEQLQIAGRRAETRIFDLLTQTQRARYEQLVKQGEGVASAGQMGR